MTRLPTLLCAALMGAGSVAQAAPPTDVVPPALGNIPSDIARLTLPKGPLVWFSGSSLTMTFEDVERSAFNKSGGEVVTYDVLLAPIATKQGLAVQMVRRTRVVCADSTTQDFGSMAYDRRGSVVMWLPRAEARAAVEDGYYVSLLKLVCDGLPLPTKPVIGHEAAMALAHMAI